MRTFEDFEKDGYITIGSGPGGTYTAGGGAILPSGWTNGDTLRIMNNTGGDLTISAENGGTINSGSKPFVSRFYREVLVCTKVTGGWDIVTNSHPTVDWFRSTDGTVAKATQKAAEHRYNDDDVILVTGCTTDSDNGLYYMNGGSWTKQETTEALPVSPFYSQIYGGTLSNTTTFQTIPLTTTDLDGSGSDYTITLASNRVEFDDTDGTKTYRVGFVAALSSSSPPNTIEIKAELDGTLISRSDGTITSELGEIAKTFVVTPPTSVSNNNYLDVVARHTDSLGSPSSIDDFLLTIERIA